MSNEKNYKKKLTDAGVGVCVLTFISLVIAIVGTMLEFIATSGYNQYFGDYKSYILVDDFYSFVCTYERSIILTAITFILFISALSAVRKKKLGWEFPAMSIIMSIVLAVQPIMTIAKIVSAGEFSKAWNSNIDESKVEALLDLSVSVFPVFSCFFLLIAGLTSLGRFMGEDFGAKVPITKKVSVMPENVANSQEQNSDNQLPQPNSAIREDDLSTSNGKYVYGFQENASAVTVPNKDEIVNEDAPSEIIAQDENKCKCEYCGAEVSADAKFCGTCGKNIE